MGGREGNLSSGLSLRSQVVLLFTSEVSWPEYAEREGSVSCGRTLADHSWTTNSDDG